MGIDHVEEPAERAETPLGFDPERRRRFERFNRHVATTVLVVILGCVGALVYAEVLSAELTQRGWDLLHENPDEAVAVLGRAGQLKKTNARAVYGLWQGLFILERFDEALPVARDHVKLNMLSGEAHVELALTILRAGGQRRERCAEAITHLARASSLNPTNFTALDMLADCYLEIGDLEGALIALARLKRAYMEYIEICNRVIGTPNVSGRELAYAYNDLAWILATSRIPSLQDKEEALLYAKRSVELLGEDPDRSHVLDTLAEAHFVNGEVTDAIMQIENAIALKPERLYYYIMQRRRFLREWRGVAI